MRSGTPSMSQHSLQRLVMDVRKACKRFSALICVIFWYFSDEVSTDIGSLLLRIVDAVSICNGSGIPIEHLFMTIPKKESKQKPIRPNEQKSVGLESLMFALRPIIRFAGSYLKHWYRFTKDQYPTSPNSRLAQELRFIIM